MIQYIDTGFIVSFLIISCFCFFRITHYSIEVPSCQLKNRSPDYCTEGSKWKTVPKAFRMCISKKSISISFHSNMSNLEKLFRDFLAIQLLSLNIILTYIITLKYSQVHVSPTPAVCRWWECGRHQHLT